MKPNYLFYYFLRKGDKKSAMRIKVPFFWRNEPHQKEIRRKRKLEKNLERLRLLARKLT